MFSFGGVYENNDHNLSFGIVQILTSNPINNESYRRFLLYDFNFDSINFYINQECIPYSKIISEFDYLVDYYEKSELGFRFKNSNFHNIKEKLLGLFFSSLFHEIFKINSIYT